jgi:hypothetical protein
MQGNHQKIRLTPGLEHRDKGGSGLTRMDEVPVDPGTAPPKRLVPGLDQLPAQFVDKKTNQIDVDLGVPKRSASYIAHEQTDPKQNGNGASSPPSHTALRP